MSVRLACYVFVLGCTFVCAVLQHTQGFCKQNWIRYDDNCYLSEFINKKTWPEAQKTCRQMNMDLVSIHSERENSFIYNIIKIKSQDIWIGLKRQSGGTLNGFGWTDNSLANFTKWSSEEPNNHLEKENCGEMYYWSGHWNDYYCAIEPINNTETKQGFICKAQTYGPSNVSLSGPLTKHLSPQQTVHIFCTAYDVFPGVQYSWSGVSCVQGELIHGSTCTFTPTESDDGKTVTCTAKNVKNISLLRTASYRINIAVETTTSAAEVTTSHGHHDITCTESRMEFSIPLSSPHTSETATLSDPNCQINVTRTHVRGGVDLNSCGTTVQFQNDSVIFRNAIIFSAPESSSLGSSGSNDSVSQYQDIIPIQCVYNRIATVHLSYMPVVRRVLFTESGVGQFSFNIQQFWDASFTNMVSDRAYPLRMELDADVFIQLSVGSEGQPVAGHKEIGMEVQQCLVSPSSSVIEAQLHYYPLIQDGCPASSDVHIIPNTNASDSTVMRFRFRAVNFFDPSSSSSSSLVFVHCRMGLCLTGSCKPSAWSCLTPPARRVRRDVDQSKRAAHQLSTGPFLIMADEASTSSSSTTATVMAVVSTSVATVAIVIAAIALIALRRRRTTAGN